MDLFNIIEIIVLVCLFILLWTYAFYPATLLPLSILFGKKIKRQNIYPEISVIIAAYNEERLIANAIKAIRKSDYPPEKIEIICGSDGSTDSTVDILKEIAANDNKLKIYNLPRMGKNAVLNEITPGATGEIICYTDADCRVGMDTIRLMMQNYADDTVGGVISPMASVIEGEGDTGGMGETMYQKYESHIRYHEGRICTTVNGLGAFYSVRRELYRPLPDDMVCDDFMPVLEVARARKRMIFDKRIRTMEVREKSLTDELSRRIRVAAGGLSTIRQASDLLSPLRGWVSFFLWSHKLLRTLSPLFLILLLAGTPFVTGVPELFWPLAIGQSIIYIPAVIGYLLEKIGINLIFFRMSLYFVTMNIGFLAAIFRFLGGRQNAKWQRD